MPQFLGQHFLKNNSAITKIIAALDIKDGETVIEIGPGKGALTLPLIENYLVKDRELRIIAIEKDKKLAEELKKEIEDKGLKNIEIIEGDALEVLTDLTNDKQQITNNYKIVGNIPYYITGKLLRTVGELRDKPELTVLMIQKEVAERIVAKPPKQNLLSAATQFWAKPEIILRLKQNDFDPPPEVESAVIKLTTKVVIPATEPGSRNLDSRRSLNDKGEQNKIISEEENKYYETIHIIFKQPRKTLLNNLKEGTEKTKEELENILNELELPLNCRPQDLSIEKILELSRII